MGQDRGDGAGLLRRIEQIPPLSPSVLEVLAAALAGQRSLDEVATALYPDLLRKPEVAGLAEPVWRHTLAVAAVARELAPTLSGDPNRAMVLGLLHELGRLATAAVAPELLEKVHGLIEKGAPQAESERRVLEIRPSFLTVAAARTLGVPPTICASLFALDGLEGSTPADVLAVAAADHLAPLFGYPVYRHTLGVPADPVIERAVSLTQKEIRRFAEAAASAVSGLAPIRDDEIHPVRADGAYEGLFHANRRLILLNARYDRARRELETRAQETQELIAAFTSLRTTSDADQLRYQILTKLHDRYGVAATFLVESGDRPGIMHGHRYRVNLLAGPEFMPLRIDFSRFDRESREDLMRGNSVLARIGGAVDHLRQVIGEGACFCIAPLTIRGSCTGLLGMALNRESEIAQVAPEFLSILAAAAALGLENARFYSETLRIASTDPVTGAATRRVIMEFLEREIATTKQTRSPIGVLLVDLDNFKAVNDTLGHHAGDRFLRDVVVAIRAAIRPGDAFGRYGGDEFLIVAPGASPSETRELAERVLASIAELAENVRYLEVPAPLGATIGVAWDTDGVDATSLTTMADTSLYAGKTSGRSKIGPLAIRESV